MTLWIVCLGIALAAFAVVQFLGFRDAMRFLVDRPMPPNLTHIANVGETRTAINAALSQKPKPLTPPQ